MNIHQWLTRLLLPALAGVNLLSAGCTVGHPFKGPGYDRSRGVTHADAGDRVLVAVTTGEVKPGSGSAFSEQLAEVMQSLPGEGGLIGYAVRRELFGRRVWTMSVWTDQAAMDRFLTGQAHRRAVRAGGIPAETVRSTTYWLATGQAPPSWEDAVVELEAQHPRGTGE